MGEVKNNHVVSPSGFKIFSLLKRVGLDWFILGLISMIFVAYLWPEGGIKTGYLSLPFIANAGVSLIFFFYGLRLEPAELKAGLNNWRLHSVVHISTFIVFPLFVLAFKSLYHIPDIQLLWLGVFYLACLPSTVSSSVVMVSIARGNIPAAIFNASISSLAGVFITPLWMGLFLETSGNNFQLWNIIGKLILQVLVPVILGILLHAKWGSFALKHKRALRYFDQIIILLIVYTSFSASFAQHMFTNLSYISLILLGGLMLGLFFFIFFLIQFVCKFLGFNREDKITAVFCGSKKSLVHGTVMSKVLFTGSNLAGVILLPVMMYHALQLIAASIIAQSMAKQTKGVPVTNRQNK